MTEFMLIDAASVDICAKIRDVRLSDRRMTIDVKDAIVLAKIAPAAKQSVIQALAPFTIE